VARGRAVMLGVLLLFPALSAGCAPPRYPAPGGTGNAPRSPYSYPLAAVPRAEDIPRARGNPVCTREPLYSWWEVWDDRDDGSLIQFAFLPSGFIAEQRFVQPVWLLWQWSVGRSLLERAAAYSVTVRTDTTGAVAQARNYAMWVPARRLILVHPEYTKVSTVVLAEWLAHELQHVADTIDGRFKGASAEQCRRLEANGYGMQQLFAAWIVSRFGPWPSMDEVAGSLSDADQRAFASLYRVHALPRAEQLDELVVGDYRAECG
jgi:hypothetical protein